jgi:sigma-B regulation protein RsbU (phosphoserine phosphatase)
VTVGNGEALDGFIDALLDDDPAELYDRAPCGYLSTTPDGSIVKVNATFSMLTGYSREELIGRRRFVDLLSGGGQIYHETHYAPMLRMHGAAREIALDLVRSDGERLPVLVNAVLERDDDGRPRIIRIAVFDATQRRAYERELLREKQRAEESEAHATALARTLQETLIPPTPPSIPQLDVAAQYRPAGDGAEVGGDFYDVFQIGPGDWVVSIGDVCGKGVEAAVVTALVRHTLRAATVESESPAEALRVLNRVMLARDADRFCTVALLRLKQMNGSWRGLLSCGGHPQPMLRSASGEVRQIGSAGSLLGVLPDIDADDVEQVLEPGDTLLLFTDGVVEARRGSEFYGTARLGEIVAQLDGQAEEFAATVLFDVLIFQDGAARDDIAVVAIHVPAAGQE